MPGGTNRVRALRADRDTAPAAERIVGNETASKLPVIRGAPGVAAAAAASEAAFAAGRADRERARPALHFELLLARAAS
jgi:hypothetical protein